MKVSLLYSPHDPSILSGSNGLLNNSNNNNGGNFDTSFDSSGTSGSYGGLNNSNSNNVAAAAAAVRQVHAHPSLPWTAYVEEFSPSSSSSSSRIRSSRVYVLDYIRGEVIINFTQEELQHWTLLEGMSSSSSSSSQSNETKLGSFYRNRNRQHPHTSNNKNQEQQKTKKPIGSIRQVKFFDRHTLHWDNMNHYYYAGLVSKSNSNKNNEESNCEIMDYSHLSHYLIVHCDLRIILINLTKSPKSQVLRVGGISNNIHSIILDAIGSNSIIKSSSQQMILKPSTMAHPITPSMFLLGCSNGSICVYDWVDKTMVESFRVVSSLSSNSKTKNNSEAIVQILIVNHTNHVLLNNDNNIENSTENTPMTQTRPTGLRIRFIALNLLGIGFLVEMKITQSQEKQKIIDFDILGRIPKLSSQMSFADHHLNDSRSTLLSTGNGIGSLMYDADRDFLIGILRNTSSSSSDPENAKVGVWDLSNIVSTSSSSLSSSKKATKATMNKIPVLEPFLTMKLSNLVGITENNTKTSPLSSSPSSYNSTAGVGNSQQQQQHQNGSLFIASSSQSPKFPDSVISGWMANKSSGTLFLLVSPVTSSLNMTRESATKPFVNYSFCLNSGSNNNFQGRLPSSTQIKILSMDIPRFRSHLVVLGTNIGLLVLSVEDDTLPKVLSGSRHVSLKGEDASFGGILFTEGSSVFAAKLTQGQNKKKGNKTNKLPILSKDDEQDEEEYQNQTMAITNPVLVYKSPNIPIIMSPSFVGSNNNINNKNESNIQHNVSIIRLPPRLFVSPSRDYICLFWHAESRYEILHIPSILKFQQQKTSRDDNIYPSPVDFGSDITSFAWIGQDDAFAILHCASHTNSLKTEKYGGVNTTFTAANEKKAPFGKIKSKIIRGGKSVLLSPSPLNSAESKRASLSLLPLTTKKDGTVELRILISSDGILETTTSIAAATALSLGDITLRGGGHALALFGGPVLCIVSSSEKTSSINDDDYNRNQYEKEGVAYFYSTSRTESLSTNDGMVKASSFMSVGPSLPHPDLVVWSDDAKHCCIALKNRLYIYLSKPPKEFILLGTCLLSGSGGDSQVQSAKFIHNVLYCTSRTSVQCIFFDTMHTPSLSQQETEQDEKRSNYFHSYVLASSNVPKFYSDLCRMNNQRVRKIRTKGSNKSKNNYSSLINHHHSLTPPNVTLNLGGDPSILSYYQGNLLVSTPSSGILSINLSYPLLRIGVLLSCSHISRAIQWVDSVDSEHHEELARFIEFRGYPRLAVEHLYGLSLETVVDLCIKHGFSDILEDLIEQYNISNIRKIDHVRSSSGLRQTHTTVECVGAFLLSQGKTELVRRMVSECIVSGEEARREAFFLASLLLSVDPGDAKRLVKRAVGAASAVKRNSTNNSMNNSNSQSGATVGNNSESTWAVGDYVRDYVL